MSNRVRAKAGLPWTVTGTYTCDKCHNSQIGTAGVMVARCTALRADKTGPCNCAYFVLVEVPDPVNKPESPRNV